MTNHHTFPTLSVRPQAGTRLMNSVQRPWSLCENLGATESIITCPSVMTHGNMLKEDRLKVIIAFFFNSNVILIADSPHDFNVAVTLIRLALQMDLFVYHVVLKTLKTC